METPDNEEARARTVRDKHTRLRSLAREALEEHRQGETRPLDELLYPFTPRAQPIELKGSGTSSL
jgi:hypothetical protein